MGVCEPQLKSFDATLTFVEEHSRATAVAEQPLHEQHAVCGLSVGHTVLHGAVTSSGRRHTRA